MGDLIVGISDIKVSNNLNDTIVTYALGSCIGIAVYDPIARVGGMLHYMLPDSTLDERKAKENPAMFADTGIPLLFKTCYGLGAEKKRMIVKVAGGPAMRSCLCCGRTFASLWIGNRICEACQRQAGRESAAVSF